jgi:hypothetical protein
MQFTEVFFAHWRWNAIRNGVLKTVQKSGMQVQTWKEIGMGTKHDREGVIMFEKFMMATNALIASGVWVTLIYIVSSK